MQYVRMYADADGESHFEDVEIPMESVTTSTGVSTSKGHSGALEGALTFTRVDPSSTDPGSPSSGERGPWHPEPHSEFIVYLEGEVEIQVSDGEIRRFGPGKLLLADDTTGKGHRNRRLTPEMRSIFIPLAPNGSAT